jgi:hypothetical protein
VVGSEKKVGKDRHRLVFQFVELRVACHSIHAFQLEVEWHAPDWSVVLLFVNLRIQLREEENVTAL